MNRLHVFLVASIVSLAPVVAQDSPNEEPSSFDTLFEQSDLGNVAQSARMSFAAGERSMDQAAKLARKAEEAPEAKRPGILDKRTKAIERAVEEYREAIGLDRDLLAAYGGLGRAFTALGRHQEALQVYSAGVKLAPTDLELFRGWADSLLSLDLLGDATSAYSAFSASEPQRAIVLLESMKSWLESRRADPGDLDPADVQRMAEWIAQHDGSTG